MRALRVSRVSLVSLVCLVLAGSAVAQDAAPGTVQGTVGARAGHDWTRVQAIPAGTLVHVKGGAHSGPCRVAGVETEQLLCEGGKSYSRTEVQRVALSRRGASAAGMGALGACVGVLTTTIVSKAGGLGGGAKGSVWAGAAGMGAVIFAPIGFFGDPFRGPVVYTAR